jgi:nucleoid DNA-binding protein
MGNYNVVIQVAQRLGIKPKVCSFLIKVIRDHVIRELQLQGECALLGVGVFKLHLGKKTRVLFRASNKLLLDLRDNNYIERDLSSGLAGELADVLTKRTNELFFETLGAPRASMFVSRNFAYYLKNKFPLDKPWVDPQSKKQYSIDEIKKALEVYQSIEPTGYVLLWTIWVSIEARELIIRKQKLTPEEIVNRWYSAVDSVLFILFNPGLTPVRLKETPILDEVDPKPTVRYRKRLDYYLSPFVDKS